MNFQRPDIQCVNGGLGCFDGFDDEGTGCEHNVRALGVGQKLEECTKLGLAQASIVFP